MAERIDWNEFRRQAVFGLPAPTYNPSLRAMTLAYAITVMVASFMVLRNTLREEIPPEPTPVATTRPIVIPPTSTPELSKTPIPISTRQPTSTSYTPLDVTPQSRFDRRPIR